MSARTFETRYLQTIRGTARNLNDSAACNSVALGLLLATVGRLETVIRPAFQLAKGILPCETLGYFWADQDGNMLNAFVERPYFLRAEVVMSCMRFQEEDPNNWPSFNENVLAGPVSGYLLPYQTADFYHSEHFNFTYAQIDAHHVLDIVVHDGERPHGCFLAMRPPQGPAFSEDEIRRSRALSDMFLIQPGASATPLPTTRRSDAGRVVIDRQGSIQFIDAAAHQSLWMMTRHAGAPPFGEADETAERLFELALADAAETAWRSGRCDYATTCPWGDFEADLFVAGNELFVTISQIEPYQAELARRLAESGLSPTRIIICWFLVSGMQRKQIAASLEVSMDTLSEHITAIYRALKVRSATELIVRLIG